MFPEVTTVLPESGGPRKPPEEKTTQKGSVER